jgi:glycerophosphoryl diester phosphodiesterase
MYLRENRADQFTCNRLLNRRLCFDPAGNQVQSAFTTMELCPMTLRKTLWLLPLLMLAGYLAARLLPAQPGVTHAYFEDAGFEVIAHGAGQGRMPKNTLEAASFSSLLGTDVLEIDIHASRDGVLLLSHDDSVDDMTDGSGLIREMTFAELQQLDAAYGFKRAQGAPLRGTGIRLPALDEVFSALPQARYVIEIKQQQPAIAAPLCAMIRSHRLQSRVLVGSFGSQALDDFREYCPEVATSLSRAETTALVLLHKFGLAHLYPLPGVALQVPLQSSGIPIISRDFVRDMQERGLRVQVWTINDLQQMRELIDLGVDGIITDYPDLLQAVHAGSAG